MRQHIETKDYGIIKVVDGDVVRKEITFDLLEVEGVVYKIKPMVDGEMVAVKVGWGF